MPLGRIGEAELMEKLLRIRPGRRAVFGIGARHFRSQFALDAHRQDRRPYLHDQVGEARS